MKSPFKFLDAFELRDREVFFGRDEEIDDLYRMINKNRLVLVYGQSGTGKTSLVQCGLASRYDATDWLPVFVRRGQGIMLSLAEALSRLLKRPLPEGPPMVAAADIDAAYAIYLRPLYLIFDQFEELFILGKDDEQQQFIETIATLHRAELPCRILFIIREEYLAALYNFEKTIPSLFDRRLRVEPMSAVKVKDVLRQSFARFNISLENPEHNLGQIVDNISSERAGVQLPYLQVYLDQLWQEDYTRTYGDAAPDDDYPALCFGTQEIDDFGDITDVLGRFLRRQRAGLQRQLDEGLPGQTTGQEIVRLLNAFVTEEGTKRPVTLTRHGNAATLHNIPEGELDDLPGPLIAAGLDLLERSRLLRVTDTAAELAHDTLAALIDGERSVEQRKINEVRSLLRTSLLVFQRSDGRDYPGEKLLLDTEELLDKLRLPPELLDFYEKSRAELTRRARAERDEAERLARADEALARAEEEKKLRQEAELQRHAAERERQVAIQAKRRAAWRAVAATVLAIIAFSVGVFAFYQRAQAEKQRANAEDNARKAHEQEAIAIQERKKAEDNAQLAQRKAREAFIQRMIAQQEAAKARAAAAQLKLEQAAKERLQFSAKADIVESFLKAGYCQLAEKARIDLQKIADNNPKAADYKVKIAELQQQIVNCQNKPDR